MSSEHIPFIDETDDGDDTINEGQGGATTENERADQDTVLDCPNSEPDEHDINSPTSNEETPILRKHHREETLKQESLTSELEVSWRHFEDSTASSSVASEKNTQENVQAITVEVTESRQPEATNSGVDPDRILEELTNFLHQNKNERQLNISDEKLPSIPSNISSLKQLEELHCSGNCLQAFPTEICKLKHLFFCDLSRNNIDKIPKYINQMKSLKFLNLSYNKLESLPEEICSLPKLEELDVSFNRITTLPEGFSNMAKHLKCLGYVANPWTQPPMEVFAQGVQDILQYFKELKKTPATDIIPEQKVIFLGDYATSFVEAFTLEPAKSIKLDERPSINVHTWRPKQGVVYYLYNFEHPMTYKKAKFLFLNQRAIHLITFNIEEFSQENIKEKCEMKIFPLLTMVEKIIPGAVVRIVGTHSDKLSTQTRSELSKSICSCISVWIQERKDEINDYEEDRISSSKAKSKSPQVYKTRTSYPLMWDENIHLVLQAQGAFKVQDLQSAVTTTSKELPFGFIPRTWYKLADKLCNHKHFMVHPMESIKKTVANELKLKGESLEAALRYLHNVGKILWFGENADLKAIVFHGPHSIMNLLNSLFRIKTDNFFVKSNPVFKRISLTKMEAVQDRVEQCGMVEYNMLETLWQLEKPPVSTLCLLLENFAIGYKIKKKNDLQNLRSFIKVPLLVSDYSAEEWDEKCQPKIDQYERPFALSFEFNDEVPNGFYEKSTIFVHDMGLEHVYEWKHGIFAMANFFIILIENDERRNAVVLQIWSSEYDYLSTWKQVCSEKNAIFQKMSTFLKEKLKAEYEVFITCPHCIIEKSQNPFKYSYEAMENESKLLNPGEMIKCRRCQQPIKIEFIFPPVIIQNTRMKRIGRSIQNFFSSSQTSLLTIGSGTEQEFRKQRLLSHSSQGDLASGFGYASQRNASNQTSERDMDIKQQLKDDMPPFENRAVSMPNISGSFTTMTKKLVSDEQLSELSRNIGYPKSWYFTVEILKVPVFRLPDQNQFNESSFFTILCNWRTSQGQDATAEYLLDLLKMATKKEILIDEESYKCLQSETTLF